jgi:hypothetical protein|nr:MAG TPA: hypothetical protein [Caudoviricetes sp.]
MSKLLAVDGQRFVQTTFSVDEKTGETQIDKIVKEIN